MKEKLTPMINKPPPHLGVIIAIPISRPRQGCFFLIGGLHYYSIEAYQIYKGFYGDPFLPSLHFAADSRRVCETGRSLHVMLIQISSLGM